MGPILRVKSGTHNKDGNPANVWKRNLIVAPPITLSLTDGNISLLRFIPNIHWCYCKAACGKRSMAG